MFIKSIDWVNKLFEKITNFNDASIHLNEKAQLILWAGFTLAIKNEWTDKQEMGLYAWPQSDW